MRRPDNFDRSLGSINPQKFKQIFPANLTKFLYNLITNSMAKKEIIPELEKLRSFRKRSGWSYAKIGAHMRLHPQTIGGWCTGKHKPSGLAKDRLRHFLDIYDYRKL